MKRALDLRALSMRVGQTFRARGQRIATAESCTAGWIAKAITDIAGSSQWFEAGLVTYSNGSKIALLGVRSATLRRHGAVSEAVVREMARGALAVTRADVCVAVSGIAGPDGGTPDKPVGTVWFCWAWRRGRSFRLRTRRVHFTGGRKAVREKSVALALRGLLRRTP